MQRKILAISLLLLVLLFAFPAAAAATWGSYAELERITIPYSEFATTATTWHPLSKAYDLAEGITLVIDNELTYNVSAAEQKALIKLAGSDNTYHLDIVFFSNGAIDIVETTPSAATKIGGIDSAGGGWRNYDYILVKIDGKTVKLLAPNGTVLTSVTWSTAPPTLEQIGASGVDGAVVGGQVIVAVVYDPYATMAEQTVQLFSAVLPLIVVLFALALVMKMLSGVTRAIGRALG